MKNVDNADQKTCRETSWREVADFAADGGAVTALYPNLDGSVQGHRHPVFAATLRIINDDGVGDFIKGQAVDDAGLDDDASELEVHTVQAGAHPDPRQLGRLFITIAGRQRVQHHVAGFGHEFDDGRLVGFRVALEPQLQQAMPFEHLLEQDVTGIGMVDNRCFVDRHRAVDHVEVAEALQHVKEIAAGLDGGGRFRPDRRCVQLPPGRGSHRRHGCVALCLDVGVRSINALLTVGRGQRLGLSAPSGVGKSVLLCMMTRFTNADVIVVGLVGERGREVKEFIDQILGSEGLARSVVVATPADNPPLMRLHGAAIATSIAEYFRDTGRHVLLLMDSLTRYAQAQREIALTIGEPPATRGFPPSVFARLPQLVERAGTGLAGQGSITAIYTVLTEADDPNDPIAEAARAILDGHIVLSQRLVERGIYIAIDIEASISRTMPQITGESHQKYVKALRHFHSLYEQNADLLSVGAYQRGSSLELDTTVDMRPVIMEFLSQDMRVAVDYDAAETAS